MICIEVVVSEVDDLVVLVDEVLAAFLEALTYETLWEICLVDDLAEVDKPEREEGMISRLDYLSRLKNHFME